MTIITGGFFMDSGDNKSTVNIKQKSEINALVLPRSRENPL